MENVEAVRLIRYRQGEGALAAHADARPEHDTSLWLSGQRLATVMLQLGALPDGAGGDLLFPLLEEGRGKQVALQPGSALVWPTTDRDGQPDKRAARKALPLQTAATKYVAMEPPATTDDSDYLVLMQTGKTPKNDTPTNAEGSGTTPRNLRPGESDPQPTINDTAWFSVAANFEGDFTVEGLLRLLQKILHEMLQQSFALPSDYLTSLAYHACYYMSKLQSTNERHLQQSGHAGVNPEPPQAAGPTAMVFCITNALLQDGRAIFKSWARDPQAPGALPGTAASQNALDGVSWAFLAIEEGGVATLDEALQNAWQATQRCNKYMDELLAWIEKQFQANTGAGSPSPKRRRTEV
ncbi:unnamed protein product, partial [Symbiodinium necroappetens]